MVKVVIDEGDEKEIREYKAEQLKFKPRHRRDRNKDDNAEELKELERLEKSDGRSRLDEE